MLNNKKGFSLAELVAVMAILMILAAASTPFVRGYIQDAQYGKAKAILREIYEAKKNFEKDYEGTVITGSVPVGDTRDKEACATKINKFYNGENVSFEPQDLINCSYLKTLGSISVDSGARYSFSIVTDICNSAAVVSMRGNTSAGDYSGKCAYIDKKGILYEDSSN